MISALRRQGIHQAEIARNLGRHRSTISRELKRNSARYDGRYRPSIAVERTNGRRSRSRKKSQFSPAQWRQVYELLREDWSPEQISGHLRVQRTLSISHETIYRHVRRDRWRGGMLFKHLRCSRKRRRKIYRSRDSRGRLPGKRMIGERPASIEQRRQIGHWEIDTMMAKYGTKPCIVTLVERKSGYLMIGKARGAHDRGGESADRAVDQTPPRSVRHDHGRQRHRVSWLRNHRTSNRRDVLLRSAVSLVGTRQQREHRRLDPTVPTERDFDGGPHSASMQCDRRQTQPPTEEATWLQNTSSGLRLTLSSVALQS